MDITETLAPKSDQVNADDLIGGPITVTITGVSRGDADQPVNIELAELPGRAYRPCKSMRRVLVHAWGKDASAYVGRRLTLFNDQSVKWAGQSVGGIRISAMSHIKGRITLALTVTRGKRSPFVVDPLPDGPASRPSDPSPPESGQPDSPASSAQNRKMHALFRDAAVSERADRLAVTGAILGFSLTTSSSLTVSEASKLIDTLDQWQAKGETDHQVREILNRAALAAETDTTATGTE